MSFFLTKWIHNWHVTQWMQEHLAKDPEGHVTVGTAVAKLLTVIDKALAVANSAEAQLIASIISDEGQESIEKVKEEVLVIRAQLAKIQTLPDISDALKDYKFADSKERNDFYHELIATATLMADDGDLSRYEVVSFLVKIALFIKKNK